MSLISVTNVEVLQNPAKFTDKFQFEISFECIAPVQEELEWKLVYVGSAEDEQYDQELDSVLVGPIIVGKNKFVFEADAPDAARIPAKDLMEVTVLLLTCAYKEKEFIRIGYYVNNDFAPTEVALVQEREVWLQKCADLNREYSEAIQQTRDREEQMRASGQLAEGAPGLELPHPPTMPQPPRVDITKLTRNILADKPRVTRFQIPWDEVDQSQEFAMDAADEAKAATEAEAVEAAADSTAAPIEDEEEEEDDSEEDADVEMDEGEDGEVEDGEEAVDETDSPVQNAGPQSMLI